MKHTPGPWRYYKQGDGTRFHITARANGTPGNHVDDFATVDIRKEDNARLIAAAPELLAAAIALLNKIDDITTEDFSKGGEREERETLREIIAKAIGE